MTTDRVVRGQHPALTDAEQAEISAAGITVFTDGRIKRGSVTLDHGDTRRALQLARKLAASEQLGPESIGRGSR